MTLKETVLIVEKEIISMTKIFETDLVKTANKWQCT